MSDKVSVQEALLYVMVTMSAADSSMPDAELGSIGDLVKTLPVFAGFDGNRVVTVAQACGELLQRPDGLDHILEIVADSLSPRLYDTAYALAVEVAASDGTLPDEELRLLEILRDRLNLDKLTVAAIERSAQARFRSA
ncbi:Tellurite resistance protein TerB [Microvirga tunisiensis]|uniref:Tellurite resistance protein TerB n=2 Tax=Pannonibacter tanglangensis TaxID=2750084 RepID=A0ABW9ZIN0_9HYPH|nr:MULTISPECIES: tellurite resistance TerB family protein [unclassified Pannonibacter]NBN64284.1 Tellurite resistance protein TerB [Pannonibacter sp. XCT-34]NBN78817.1 Tellurite resistance protein TerB [Pannonibacter sp. XCT-53]